MRRVTWGLLLAFAFAVPWEYSLDLGRPLGNIARLIGLALIAAAVPAVLQTRRARMPGPIQWLTLVFFLWICCTYFWTIDPAATLEKMRGYAQELMVVWLVWEFAESSDDLRTLLWATVAGSWVLALLTLQNFSSAAAIVAGQIRFAATGQDPNDVARFLDMGFPLAALLLATERHWAGRLLALGYLPLGLAGVLLTASRGGFVAAVVGLAGCAIVLMRSHTKTVLAGLLILPAVAAGLWMAAPHETLERLATIPEQIQRGTLNQRLNIWSAGWHALMRSPVAGTGAGTFTSAAGLSPFDTAHNTLLSLAVSCGICGAFLMVTIVVLAAGAALRTRGVLRLGLVLSLAVWAVTAMVATVEESRTTWLLIALMALAGRLETEEPETLRACFPDAGGLNDSEETAEQTA